MKEDKIGQLFNVPPLLPTVKEDKGSELIPTNDPPSAFEAAEEDFDVARDAMTNALEMGETALNSLSELVKQSQHPRAFEVMATMMNSIGSLSKDLVNLHKQKKDLIAQPENKQTINNNLVISTNDLLDMIKKNDK